MKRKQTFIRYQFAFSILISILLLNASVASGQTKFTKEELQKISDNPLLQLSQDKKNWQSIPTPKFEKQAGKLSPGQAGSVLEYNILTRTISRVDNFVTQKISAPDTISLSTSQSFGIFETSEQIETIFPPDNRIKISPTVDFPWRTICKLFITFPDGNRFVASGTLIGRDDGISFHCLTAAHCVYRKDYGGYASTVEIIPGLDNDYTPFYSAWATKIRIIEDWTMNPLPEFDMACLTLDRQLGNFTGWMSIFTTPQLSWYKRNFLCAGYPIDRDFGLCLYFANDSCRAADDNFIWYNMDASEGQDGMPIWTKDDNTRRIVAIHVGDDDGFGSNRGIRINADKFKLLNQWTHEDLPPLDLPDLVDDGPKWSNFRENMVVRGFSKFVVWNDVRNIGTAYSGSLTVAYYASLDANIDAATDFLIGTTEIMLLPPFAWRSSQWSGIFPEKIPAGEYYIGWVIDPENKVTEFNESNNTAFIVSKKLVVRDPYVEILTPNGGEAFAIGEKNVIKWYTAGGSGLITLDVTFDNGLNWQNLATNFPDSSSYQWLVPASQPPSFSCLIRITDTFKNLTDVSNAVFIVETRPTIPGVPQDQGAFSSKATLLFSWAGSNDPETGIAGYNIQVGTSPGGNDIADTFVEKQLSYTAIGSHNQMVYARVRAKNGVGLFSPWSAPSNGILIDLTPPILQGGPFDEGEFSGSDSVLFKWNAAVDEESGVIMNYKLQVGTAIGLNDIFDNWINRRLQYKVLGKHGQTLYARIKVHNAAIGVSDWSEWSDGITIDTTPPSAPGKPCLEDVATNSYEMLVFWDAAIEDLSGVINYHLKIIDISADSQVVFDNWIGNLLMYSVRLNKQDTYIAMVQAKNSVGLIGAWSQPSEPLRIHRDPYIKLKRPSGGEVFVIGEENLIQWLTGGGSGLIKIQASFDSGATWQNLVTNFPDSGRYGWNILPTQAPSFSCLIKITDTVKNLSDSSDAPFILETRPTAPGVPYADRAWINKPEVMFKWTNAIDPETGISAYHIQIGSTPNWYDLADTIVGNVLNYNAKGTHNQKLYARVRAKNGVGLESRWSISSEGILIDLTPPILQGDPFDDGEFSNTDSVLFKWNAAIDEESGVIMNYKLQVGTAIGLSNIFDNWINRKLEYKVKGKQGQTLYARIKVHNAALGISDWSNWSDGITIDLTRVIALGKSLSSEISELPDSYMIEQNYPNPFNFETMIRFQLPEVSQVMLKIYNILGQEVITLIDGHMPAGYHSVQWNGRDRQGNKVSSGMFIYQFKAGAYNVTKKMVLLE